MAELDPAEKQYNDMISGKLEVSSDEETEITNKATQLRFMRDAYENIIDDLTDMLSDIEQIQDTLTRLELARKRIKKTKDDANTHLPTKLKIK